MEDSWLHIRFGRFELDEAIHELRADGKPVAVEPKPLSLLLLLARNRHRVVRHEEILASLWPGIAVSEDVLARAVLKAREALGEVGAKERTIRTVRAVGFRFVSPTEEVQPSGRTVADAARGAEGASAGGPAPLIGREGELARLQGALHSALAGKGCVAQISGAAGVGKTRLATELMTAARSAGAEVHLARAWEGTGAPALWPISQVLRSFADQRTPEAMCAALDRDEVAELARVLPALRETVAVEVPPPPADANEAHFRLLNAISRALTRAAIGRPQLIVFEDMHWADESSLRVLGALAGEIVRARVLVLVTFRDEEVGPGHPLTAALAACLERDVLVRAHLHGLDAAGVSWLVASLTGFEPSGEVTATLHARTGGNPFFVKQIVALAQTEGAGGPTRVTQALAGRVRRMPPEMHHVVVRRLAMLSAQCRHVLEVAAVWGREFPLAGLARLPDLSRETLIAAISEAQGAHVIEACEEAASGGYAFAHDLLREAILTEIEPAARMQIHLQVAGALETLHAAYLDPVVPALAHHYGEAAPLAGSQSAVDYAKWAGELARAAHSYEKAAEHFERALDAQSLVAEPDLARRAELLVCLGYAQQSAGRHARARDVLREAAAVARQTGATETLATAALGFAQIAVGVLDQESIALLEEAHEALRARPRGAVHAWIEAVLAVHLANLPARLAEASALAAGAVRAARALSDPRWLGTALTCEASVARLSVSGRVAERLELLDEARQHTHAAGDTLVELMVHLQRHGALLERGDIDAVDWERGRIDEVLSRMHRPDVAFVKPALEAMRWLLEGRIDEAEQLAVQAYSAPESPQFPHAATLAGIVAAIRYEQDRLPELLGVIGPMMERQPNLAVLRAVHLLALSSAGRCDEARAALATAAERRFEDVIGTESWPLALSLFADVAVRVGDAAHARVLAAALAPRADLCAIVSNGNYCHGPVALYLGKLACAAGEFDAAEQHLERASELAESLRSPVWRAHTLAARARLERMHGARQRARDRAAEALAIARQHGLERLRRELSGSGWTDPSLADRRARVR